jgi:hypothetical protein
MDLARLAAKQKRWKDISDFAAHDVTDPTVRKALVDTLSRYHSALAECWKKQASTPEDEVRLASLERDLDRLHNEARLTATPARA